MELTKNEYQSTLDRISYLLDNSEKNIELEALFNPVSQKKNINRHTFEKIIARLKGLDFQEIEQPEQLDIRCDDYSNIRISIKSIEDIFKYCNSNELDEDMNLEFISKERIDDKELQKGLDIRNYNFRVNLKEEELLSLDDNTVLDIMDNIKKLKKSYRLKKRLSFITPDNLFRYDLTVLKESDKYPEGNYKLSTNLLNSNILNKHEIYEVELEFIGKHEELDKNVLFDNYINYIGLILQVIQSTDSILSNTQIEAILDDYKQLIQSGDRLFWIGPQPVSLEMSVIRCYEDSTITTIAKNYSVTDKADGERNVMYVNNQGNVYLINNRWNVIDLGLIASNLKNSLIDGEYVLYDKNGHYKPMYLAYDIYFLRGKDIRDFPLYIPQEPSCRIPILQDEFKNTTWELRDYMEKKPIIRVKKFYYGDIDECGKKIFEYSAKILQESKTDIYEYEIDGLIYTPTNLAVGAEHVKDSKIKNTGKTWNMNFKWKPPEDNTIDFLIEIDKIKDEDGNIEEKIGYYYNLGNKEPTPYKTIKLLCGYDPSRNKSHTCEQLFEGTKPEKIKAGYYPIEFKPTQPVDKEAYIANIPLEKDSNGDYRMITSKTKDEILDGMIVEMSYNILAESKWGWIPRNIRYDKTEKKLKGEKEYGNNFNTANNIWKTIHNPITIEMISTGENLPDEGEDEVRYYVKGISRNNSMTRNMLDFHNKFVKKPLLQNVARKTKGGKLLDLCCGRGGDIYKWLDLNLTFVLGVDNVKNNIEDDNGSCNRYMDIKQDPRYNGRIPEAIFIWGDASKPYMTANNDNWGLNEFNKKMMNVLWGNTNKEQLKEQQTSLWGICRHKFDIISCQFAIHYFFKQLSVLETFIENISSNVNDNGYFIGTCFDGETIYNELRQLNKGQYLIGEENHNTLWRIQKEYDNIGDTMPLDESCLSLEIKVFVETINQTLSEYLVNFSYFEKLMNQHNLYLISTSEANEIGFPNSTGLFSELFDNLSSSKYTQNALNMTSTEKQFSFYNRYFIFQKKLTKIKIKKKSINK